MFSFTWTFDGCFKTKQPLLFIAILLTIFSCTDSKQNHPDYDILFEVNGIKRTVYDFESKYVAHLITTGRNDSKVERYAFLNEKIDELILADASDEKGLLDHPIYLSAINFQQRKSMMDVFFVDEMNKLLEPPTDEEVRLAYDRKQRRVYVRQLFSMQREELLQPYERLKQGDDFVDVANDFYETEQYDSLAGYLGRISYFDVDDAFADAAFSTNEGDFTAPVRSKFGYHIIYVEYIEFPAMLAEDDYQYRKPGLTSQVQLRKQQLVSNDYVRDLMESLAVSADEKNLNDLREVILNLNGDEITNTNQTEENPTANWDDRRLDELEASFPKETVLASYVFAGERVDFTFDDYLKWLPFLSFNESKNRTGASVGRALRNEVLFKLAEKEGYDRDERVQDRVKTRGYEILAELYQYELTKEALADTTTLEVPNSFRDRLISRRYYIMEAEYWKINALDMNAAKRIVSEIEQGLNPEMFDGFVSISRQVVDQSSSDFDLVKRSLLNTPVVAHSADDGWLVLNVQERDLTEVANSTNVENLETRYKVYSNIVDELEYLREDATIVVDSVLFDDIYEVWKKKNEEE